MCCVAPAVHPLCRSLVISDHLHRIQATLNQGCSQPYQTYVGGCLLLMLLESQRSSVGEEEKRSANVQALSEATRMMFAEQKHFASL